MNQLDYRWAVKFIEQGVELWHRAPRGWASTWEKFRLLESCEQLNMALDCTGLTLVQLLEKPENSSISAQMKDLWMEQCG